MATITTNISDEAFIDEREDDYVIFLMSSSQAEQHLVSIDIFATAFIAVAKRGTVSEEFVEKISKGLEDDLQYATKIDSEVISLFYKFYGDVITPDNAQQVMNR